MNQDTLAGLLNEGSERPGLDYKSVCNLRDNGDRVEIAKDIGAMQIRGGYIVIGADNDGQPTGQVTPTHAQLFDQAALQGKIGKYQAQGFEVRSKALELDATLFGLICVLPHPDGWAPFRIDGFYRDNHGKEKQAFRAGDVFARHGTSSEPWNESDVRLIREEIRRQERDAARNELEAAMTAAQAANERAAQTASAPAKALSWALDPETLTDAIVEQIRADDDIPVISLLKTGPRDATALAVAGAHDELNRLLDALVCVTAQLITIERPQLAERAIGSLATIYNSTFSTDGNNRGDLRVSAPEVHLAVVGRVLALGAMATRERSWRIIRAAAMQPVKDYDPDYWQNWLFHGKVSAARAGLLRDDARPNTGRSPLVIAQEHVLRLACLRPDVTADDEAVLTSLCQFDMLAAFAALSSPEGKRVGSFMPNYGEFFASRTDPVVVELIKRGELRDEIFPGSDTDLASAILSVGNGATRMADWLNGWQGYEAQPILDFLATHTPPE